MLEAVTGLENSSLSVWKTSAISAKVFWCGDEVRQLPLSIDDWCESIPMAISK